MEIHKDTVLCVDPDPSDLQRLTADLKPVLEDNEEIFAAGTAEQALDFAYRLGLEGRQLSMVIADQNLPGIQGIRLLEMIHKRFPSSVKILLSRNGHLEEAVYAFNNANLDRYLSKPWVPEEMIFAVKSLLRQHRMKRINQSLLTDLKSKNVELGATLTELRDAKQEVETSYMRTIQSLAIALEAKDNYTAGHSQRVAKFAVMVAQGLGLSQTEIEMIRQVALLHDIGKIGMIDKILNKPGPLTDEERVLVRSHPTVGGQIMSPVKDSLKFIDAVKFHHENFDGSGYPAGRTGGQVSIGTRIVRLADAFDAMTSNRPYRGAQTLKYAIEEMRNFTGTQFDPECVEAFVKMLAK